MPDHSPKSWPLINRLSRLQVDKPWLIGLLITLITIPAVIGAARLGLKTDFAELLPQNKPSVIEMHRVSKRLLAASTLTIVAEGQDTEALKKFVDQTAPKLRALGPEWVGSVDDGVRDAQKFIDDNKYLYAPYDDIKSLHEEVVGQYDYEVAKKSGIGDLGLDSDDDGKREPLNAETVRARINKAKEANEQTSNPHPDGYYLGENGHLIVMLVRTPVSPGNARSDALLRGMVDKAIAEVNPRSLDPSMTVAFTGDFITTQEEYDTIKSDLANVGAWGVGLVLTVVFLFFLRFRALLAMAITIGIGLGWTFGATRLMIGYLNSSTGFLVSIIAGNGINFGIIYMARYLEARRVQHMNTLDAVRIAHHDTWLGTAAAAAAAMVAYGSLAITDFKGFKHFGLIGGVGMALCWIATYAALPSILATTEKFFPMFQNPNSWRSRVHGFYGYFFAWISERASRLVVVIAVAMGLAGAIMCVLYLRHDTMEYNLHNIATERPTGETPTRKLSGRVDQIVGRIGQDGMAVMVDRLDQAEPFKAAMEAKLAAAPENEKAFEKVVTIFSLLPDRQGEKITLVNEIVDRMTRAHTRGFISAKDWDELQSLLPQGEAKPVTIADLPEKMARPFTEIDGMRGRIVYIVPKSGRSIWDAHYLELWAASFRRTTLPNGEVVLGSGRSVIFADVIQAVRDDAPKAIFASLFGTIVVVLLAFRMRKSSWVVLATLMLGVSWVGAFLYFKEIKLNFLNFVALPITFGIGADYAVNMMRRFEIERFTHLREVVIETGGAVVLCSLTTMLGYIALMLSLNKAIVSFGMIAATGEITTILAAVLVLPAAMFWRERRIAKKAAGKTV